MAEGLQFHELRSTSRSMFPFPCGLGLSPETEPLWTRLEPMDIPCIISVAGEIQCSEQPGLTHVPTSRDRGRIINLQMGRVDGSLK